MDIFTRLQIESDVSRLLGQYVHLVDTRRLDECAALFADDAVLDVMGETHEGPAAIRRWLGTLDSFGPAGKHMVCNHVITTHGDRTASAVSDFMVFKDLGGRWASTSRGAYHDEFIHRNEELCFRRRRIEAIFAKPVEVS